MSDTITIRLRVGDESYGIKLPFRKGGQDMENALYNIQEEAGKLIANTLRMHYEIGVMEKAREAELRTIGEDPLGGTFNLNTPATFNMNKRGGR